MKSSFSSLSIPTSFTRCAEVQNAGSSTDLGPWQTTGYVSDMSWAEGRRVTPSLDFRAEGAYSVRINRVGKLREFSRGPILEIIIVFSPINNISTYCDVY